MREKERERMRGREREREGEREREREKERERERKRERARAREREGERGRGREREREREREVFCTNFAGMCKHTPRPLSYIVRAQCVDGRGNMLLYIVCRVCVIYDHGQEFVYRFTFLFALLDALHIFYTQCKHTRYFVWLHCV